MATVVCCCSLSDTRVVLIFRCQRSPTISSEAEASVVASDADEADTSATARPAADASQPSSAVATPTQEQGHPSEGEVPSCGTKRKAGTLAEEVQEEGIVISMPAHKMILMAKSVYFHTRLSTALGNTTTSVVREHAASMEELCAMKAVLEFMYTEQLPLFCTSTEEIQLDTSNTVRSSQTQRLISAMVVS